MELYFLDENFNNAAIVDSVTEITWDRRFYEPSEFKMTAIYGTFPSAVFKCSYVYFHDIDECGRIENLSCDGESVTISGRGLESILEDRVIEGDKFYVGAFETALRRAVTENALGERAISHLVLGDSSGFDDLYYLTASWDNLSAWLYSTLRPLERTYKLTLDPSMPQIVFKLYGGRDRTVLNGNLPPVIFSEDFGNIREIRFSHSDENFKNTAYVRGSDGTVVNVDRSGGGEVREMFVSAGDITPHYCETRSAYLMALRQRGEEKLADREQCRMFSLAGEAEDVIPGDLCEVRIEGREPEKLRVTGVICTYRNGLRFTSPYFGKEDDPLTVQIRRELAKMALYR